MVKSVRGVAYSVRVAPAATNRMVDGARGVLNALLADVHIFTDHRSGAEAGGSPGYGLTLVAQTTTGRLVSAQAVVPPASKVGPGAALHQSVPRASTWLCMSASSMPTVAYAGAMCLLKALSLLCHLIQKTLCHMEQGPEKLKRAEEVLVQGQKEVAVPEDIGRKAAHALFEEISRGGICDSAHQVHFSDCLKIRGIQRLCKWRRAMLCDYCQNRSVSAFPEKQCFLAGIDPPVLRARPRGAE